MPPYLAYHPIQPACTLDSLLSREWCRLAFEEPTVALDQVALGQRRGLRVFSPLVQDSYNTLTTFNQSSAHPMDKALHVCTSLILVEGSSKEIAL